MAKEALTATDLSTQYAALTQEAEKALNRYQRSTFHGPLRRELGRIIEERRQVGIVEDLIQQEILEHWQKKLGINNGHNSNGAMLTEDMLGTYIEILRNINNQEQLPITKILGLCALSEIVFAHSRVKENITFIACGSTLPIFEHINQENITSNHLVRAGELLRLKIQMEEIKSKISA